MTKGKKMMKNITAKPVFGAASECGELGHAFVEADVLKHLLGNKVHYIHHILNNKAKFIQCTW